MLRKRYIPRNKKIDYSTPIMVSVLFFGAIGIGVLTHFLSSSARVRSGLFIAGMSLLSTAVASVYWWRAYRARGLKARPRISFREIYVLYFGMSVEVGMIVNCMTASEDIALAIGSILLPPTLLAIVALMDDTPDAPPAGERSSRNNNPSNRP